MRAGRLRDLPRLKRAEAGHAGPAGLAQDEKRRQRIPGPNAPSSIHEIVCYHNYNHREDAIQMIRVGIVTCANTTQELACCSHLCLRDLNEGRGTFAAYKENGGAKLVGIVSCAGCPTAVGTGKILGKIRSLVETGVDAIHFANCVVALCPFQSQFKEAIGYSFEDTELVMGTHGSGDKDTVTAFKTIIGEMLCQRRESLADVAGAMCYVPNVHGRKPTPEQKNEAS